MEKTQTMPSNVIEFKTVTQEEARETPSPAIPPESMDAKYKVSVQAPQKPEDKIAVERLATTLEKPVETPQTNETIREIPNQETKPESPEAKAESFIKKYGMDDPTIKVGRDSRSIAWEIERTKVNGDNKTTAVMSTIGLGALGVASSILVPQIAEMGLMTYITEAHSFIRGGVLLGGAATGAAFLSALGYVGVKGIKSLSRQSNFKKVFGKSIDEQMAIPR